jgi:hypothetical protein
MVDIKTVKKHLAEIFEMKEDFDVFLNDTESFDDGKRCYATYQFIYELAINTNCDIKVVNYTHIHKASIDALMNDGKFRVSVETTCKPAKHEIRDRIHIIVYERPSGNLIANFSFNTGKFNAYGGISFETSVGLTNDTTTDDERYQVCSDVAFAIMRTINWYMSTGCVSVENNQ